MRPSGALPCDDDVERRNHLPQPGALPEQFRRRVSRRHAAWSRSSIRTGARSAPEAPGPQAGGFQFEFGSSSANPFGNLTREQRLARLDALSKLLDIAFIVPGTNIRYGIDGLIGLIPVVGDIITTAISLWVVREARALGAPWHLTTRMLGNVALDGVVGLVPLAGDAFDVMFRANVRNVRMLQALAGQAAALKRCRTRDVGAEIVHLSRWER